MLGVWIQANYSQRRSNKLLSKCGIPGWVRNPAQRENSAGERLLHNTLCLLMTQIQDDFKHKQFHKTSLNILVFLILLQTSI